ncbi:MAG TPA: hypothetical protein EYH49_04435 [Aquifex aeolicus]|nr:hypothetical protein [Aquifex aeolicus]
MVLALLLAWLGLALGKPVIMDTALDIKRFPFVRYGSAWEGTPAQVKEAVLPNVVITYGVEESKRVVGSVSLITYALGQWTDDPGVTPRDVRKGKLPSVVMPFGKAFASGKNLIVVGVKNDIVRRLGLAFTGPTLKVIEWEGRKVLIVGGRNDREVVRAAEFLANNVIGFKGGAYRTFFSFVKLRGLIEHRNFIAALELIKDPKGLSACGKNMSLAAPMVLKFPPEVKKVVKKRNRIMYSELIRAVSSKDKERAVKLWREAMITCYQCHQGIGIERLRKFVPLESIHSKHQRIAKGFGLDCRACHVGVTENRGYK